MNTQRITVLVVLLIGLTGLTGCTLLTRAPIADFDVSPTVIYAGDTVTLDAAPSFGGSSIVSYEWDLGDGTTASGQRITTTYNSAGAYTVRLVVGTSDGQSDLHERMLRVYVRSGTELFFEDFSAGEVALGNWSLDPTWATEGESSITYIAGDPGFTLFVRSGHDRWHRLTTPLTLPPLRVGQRIVFTCRVMTLQNQDSHTFVIAPGRRLVSSDTGSLPYFLFTSDGGGSYMREPSEYGAGVGHPVAFKPSVYKWHTYEIVYSSDGYELTIDGIVSQNGTHHEDLSTGGQWLLLIGEESGTEACTAYYDDIRVTIEE